MPSAPSWRSSSRPRALLRNRKPSGRDGVRAGAFGVQEFAFPETLLKLFAGENMVKLPGNPSKKRVALLAAAGGFTVILVAVLLAYFVLFPTSSPKPFKLVTSATASTASTSSASPSTASTGGHWRITAGSVDVAVDTLKSDRSMRDEKIHEIGLESNRYPTATFVLSTPVTLTRSALTGGVTRVLVSGTFDIHGTSKRETLPVEFSLVGSTLEVAGSLTFP